LDALSAGDPARIGPFRLVARLGRGGMGRVYLGRAETTGRAVAVKTIHGELLVDPEFRTRFRYEVAAARRVRDEYIAEVVAADPDGATPWLATAYAPGISLEDAVRRFGALPPESVRVLGFCVARAVAAIHAVGLVHRDLKPGNVLLTASGPKVIDFGIARGVADDKLTRTGMVSGSPPYMAPEQLSDGEFGPGSDIFSIAAVLHYAATGAGPYGRGGPQEQYARALGAGPVVDPSLTPHLAAIIGQCFHRDPAARPSAAQLARQLEEYPNERPGASWLPNAVLQEIVVQATVALNTESAGGRVPAANAAPASAPQPPLVPPPLQPQSTPPRPAPQSYPRQPVQAPAAASPYGPRVNSAPNPTPLMNSAPPFAPPASLSPPHPGTPPRSHSLPPHTPQPYPAPSGPYGIPYGPPVRRDNGMATAALVVSLFGIIVPCMLVLGLIFGVLGLSKSRETGSGRSQSTAAIVISAVLILGWAVVLVILSNLHTTASGAGAPMFRDARIFLSAIYQIR
jgi:serine/threonine protein kinase